MVSNDRGRSWRSARPPEPLIDLVVDPTSADRLLAAGESRLHLSADGGKTWEQLEEGTGLLGWPRGDRLYLLDGGGRLVQSGRRTALAATWPDRRASGGALSDRF